MESMAISTWSSESWSDLIFHRCSIGDILEIRRKSIAIQSSIYRTSIENYRTRVKTLSKQYRSTIEFHRASFEYPSNNWSNTYRASIEVYQTSIERQRENYRNLSKSIGNIPNINQNTIEADRPFTKHLPNIYRAFMETLFTSIEHLSSMHRPSIEHLPSIHQQSIGHFSNIDRTSNGNDRNL